MASSSTEERTLLQERTPSGDTKPPLSPSFLTALPPDLLEKTDAFCFDCDGVIWRATELCDDRIPNVLNQLRALKKKIFFVTNNTTKAIAVYLDKLRSMGIEATEDEMYSAGAAAVDFLRLRCPEVVSSAEKVASEKVFLIGGKGLMTEFRRGKVNFIGGPEDEEFQAKEAAFFANLDNDLFKNVEIDEDVSVVLCGYDAKINYFKIQYAQLCLNEKQRGKQCKFVATNCDAVGIVGRSSAVPQQYKTTCRGVPCALTPNELMCVPRNLKPPLNIPFLGQASSRIHCLTESRAGWEQCGSNGSCPNK